MNFQNFSPWINAAIFIVAALAVWLAGTRLARYANEIGERTGTGSEFLGVLLLGGVTSLPEFAVATTATLQGTPELSVNDVLGSASVNILVLAVADAVSGRRALTSIQGSPLVMLQGVLGILLFALTALPALTGDVILLGMGAWTWAMLAAFICAIRLMTNSNVKHAWQPRGKKPPNKEGNEAEGEQSSMRRLILSTCTVGAVILVGGFLLARTGEGLAEQTGLGTSFFGVVFLAFATSLPEWSTVIESTRLGRYEMAISDILGTNLFNVAIIVFVDALHPKGPILLEGGNFPAVGALLAMVLTTFFLVGMLERRDRTVLRMGWDSIAVIVGYIGGVVVLHSLR